MASSEVGSETFKPVSPDKKIETPRDIFPLYFRLDGEDEYHSVISADSALFFKWISKYTKVIIEEGATEEWSYLDRLDIIRFCINRGKISHQSIYVKGATSDVVGQD